ncbi:MAG: hypothetical protein J5741_02815 [Bacteroidales bacterium]|nr:hypothetical protein [Bacteroidales bacterium]
MSDFDQLIREKTEQATYHYKASAWRKYSRFAGLKNLTPWLCTIGVVAVVGVSALLWNLLRTPKTVEPETTPEVMVVADDSLMSVADATTTVAEVTPLESDQPAEVAASRHQATAQVEAPALEPAAAPEPAPKPKKPSAPVYGIPVVIDVDTITQMWPTDQEMKEGNSRLY